MASAPGVFNVQELTDIGGPLVGGRVYTYIFGTTTQKTAYTDTAGLIPHTYTSDGIGGQYIALNARGELPAPLQLLAGSYDITLRRSDGSTVWTRRADGTGTASDTLRADLAAVSGAATIGGGDQIVATVAALRLLLKTSASKFAYVMGSVAAGDGGGGPYYYDAVDTTSVDNGGTVIVAADGGRWKLAPNTPSASSRIINGNFDVWQNGAGPFTNGYSADMWSSSTTGSAASITRQSHTLGQTVVPGEPQYFHRTVVTSAASATNFSSFFYFIENVRSYAGKTIAVSFYAKADAAKNIAVEFIQNFGIGGAPSAALNTIGITTKALTTGFVLQTVTVAIPSISGKTLGTTENTSSLVLNIWFDAGSSFNARTNSLGQQSGTFDISRVWIDEGSVSTSFPARPLQQEIALCQRYFEKSFAINTAPAQNAGSSLGDEQWRSIVAGATLSGTASIPFKVTKRIAPTMTYYNPANANAQVRDLAGAVDCSATVTNWVSDRVFSVNYTGNAATAANNLLALNWVADSRF